MKIAFEIMVLNKKNSFAKISLILPFFMIPSSWTNMCVWW